MLWFLLILQSFAGSAVVEVGEVEFSASAQDAVAEAYRVFDSGDFETAARLFESLADAGGGVPARVAQAIALYEAGDLRRAQKAAEQALSIDPKHLACGNILGLILVDSGAVLPGIEKLEATRALAVAAGNKAVEARALANIGLGWLDQGDVDKAKAALTQAQQMAVALNDAALQDAVADSMQALAGLSGQDQGVGQLLGKGDLKGAQATAEKALSTAKTRRDRVFASIQLAAVERAQGRLSAAITRLDEAVRVARAAGMTRELAMALGQLGVAHLLAGRQPLAADALLSGAGEAQRGGYRVLEVDLRCELGITYMQMGKVAEAEAQQRAVGALLGAMTYPQGVARQAELGGLIAAAKGDLPTATTALSRAVSHHEALGRPLDAARAATELSAALQATDPAAAQTWADRATGLFGKAGEPLGPAHIALARALADARANNLDSALTGFAQAAELAGKVGGERAAALAQIAREDAAQALVAMGSNTDMARTAANQGLTALVDRQVKLKDGFDTYDAGLAAYQAGDFVAARTKFNAARQTFEALGETAYLSRARRAAAWSLYNQAVALPDAQAAPLWTQLVDETAKLDDPELFARTYAASTLTAHALGQTDLGARYEECIRLSRTAGLPDVEARCHGAIAEEEGDIDNRATHAKQAATLAAGEPFATYALYSVAVDACNAERNALALDLVKLAMPHAGTLKSALEEVQGACGE